MSSHKIAFLILAIFLVTGTSWSDTASDPAIPTTSEKPQLATFGDIQGKVTIQHPNETEVSVAHKDSTAMEGDRVTTGAESSATLVMFDNSELNLGPDSALTLAKMRKPATDDKLLSFKLFVGRITAKVMKLASAQSSFEIDAGGVICGVRGTQFTMESDPNKHTCLLTVAEGTVWARTNGGPTQVLAAGQHQLFTNLHTMAPSGSNAQNAKSATNTNAIVNNSTAPSPLSDPALQVMTNSVQQGIKTNTNNTLNSTQQNSSIGLHVGPNEVVP